MIRASLRQRLFVIILVPLLLIAVLVGLWRVVEARKTAEDLYDRSLLVTAVAIARDVALLDGDAISPRTEALLSDTAGGPVRYHVYAPDGVFVTGYAVPPIPIERATPVDEALVYLDAVYKGTTVRVLRMRDVTQIAGFSGTFTITVWQDMAIRQGLAQSLILRALTVMAALIGTVAVVVWFGVNLGLRPLLELEDAIQRRSPDDLSPIRRHIPAEARGIVARLNRLLDQMQGTMAAQKAFISDAAHQLRNPIAAIRALGEAISTAPTLETAKERAVELVAAARQASDLAEKLLTLERARAGGGSDPKQTVDLHEVMQDVATTMARPCAKAGVTLSAPDTATGAEITGDPIMLREALVNLVDNALRHGGAGLTRIDMQMHNQRGELQLQVADDGKGLAAADIPKVMARFGQMEPGYGSGLGLPIADAVARQHGGRLDLLPGAQGLTARLVLPLVR